MSLTFCNEHLAWQQRVRQEKTRATNFNKTTTGFYNNTQSSFFPSANQDSVPANYKSLNYNLAYTFGGTKPIRHALTQSPEKLQSASASPNKVFQRKSQKSNQRKYLEKYAKELKKTIEAEKSKRREIQAKLSLLIS